MRDAMVNHNDLPKGCALTTEVINVCMYDHQKEWSEIGIFLGAIVKRVS